VGPDYVVRVSEDLVKWDDFPAATPTVFPYVWSDPNTGTPPNKRFYQVKLGP